jgi:hypothetical protein
MTQLRRELSLFDLTFINKPEQAWAGIGFLALGVPVYYAWTVRKKKQHQKSDFRNQRSDV